MKYSFKIGEEVEIVDFESDGYHEMYESSKVTITDIGGIINGKQIYHYKVKCKLFDGYIHSGTTEDNLRKVE